MLFRFWVTNKPRETLGEDLKGDLYIIQVSLEVYLG